MDLFPLGGGCWLPSVHLNEKRIWSALGQKDHRPRICRMLSFSPPPHFWKQVLLSRAVECWLIHFLQFAYRAIPWLLFVFQGSVGALHGKQTDLMVLKCGFANTPPFSRQWLPSGVVGWESGGRREEGEVQQQSFTFRELNLISTKQEQTGRRRCWPERLLLCFVPSVSSDLSATSNLGTSW